MTQRKFSQAGLVTSASLLLSVALSVSSVAQPSSGVGGSGNVPAPSLPTAPVVEERPPLNTNATVFIPVSVSATVPVVTAKTVSVSNVVKSPTAVQPNSVFDKKPVAPVRDVIVGGISASKKDDLPFTTVSNASKKPIEIQVKEDIPTTVFVSKLPARSTAQITIANPGGKAISLGSFRIDANGDLEIPPLTLGSEGKTIQLQIRVGRTVRTITIRS